MRKRAFFSPVWLACLGVAWLALPATAAPTKVKVYVSANNVLLPGATVVAQGQNSSSAPQSASPAIFALNESKVFFAVTSKLHGAGTGHVVIPQDGGYYNLMITLDGGGKTTSRLFTEEEAAGDLLLSAALALDGTRIDTTPATAVSIRRTLSTSNVIHPGVGNNAGPLGCAAGTILTHQTAPGTFDETSSVACGVGGSHTVENFYAQSFVVPAGGGALECVDFVSSQQTLGTYTVNVNIYDDTSGGAPDVASLVLLGTVAVDIPQDNIGIVSTADFSGQGINLVGGSSVVFEIHAPDRDVATGGDGGEYRVGSSGLAADGPSYLYAGGCGITDYLDVGAIGFPTSQWMYNLGIGAAGPGPTGDECADALALSPGTVSGDTSDNTGTVDDSSCGLDDFIDEWYVYTATCNGDTTVSTCGSTGTMDDTVLAVFDACGGAEIACNDDGCGTGFLSEATWAVTAGTSYYVRVAGWGNSAGTYSLTLTEACAPGGGDECETCIDGGTGASVIVSDTLDNTGTIDDSSCGLDDFVDEWICWTSGCAAGEAGMAIASTCNTADFDTVLAVFDGCAGAEIACNDDGAGCAGFTSEVEWATSGGTSYNIRLGGWGGAQGSYTLDISETCGGGGNPACTAGAGACDIPNGTPGCDDTACCESVCAADPFCCDVEWDQICADEAAADPACAGPTCTPGVGDECTDCLCIQGGDAIAGTTMDNTGTVDDSSCGLDDFVDEWYCYTATCDGTATASTCNAADFDTVLAVYDGCAGAEVACNDDGPGCAGFSSEVTWPIALGASYNIRVGGWGGSQGTYTLSLTETCGPGDPLPCDLGDVNGGAACHATNLDNANNSTAGLFTVADDFSPLASGNVTDVCWWGTYIPGQPASDTFTVTYYDNVSGLPGSVIAGPFTQGADLTVLGPVDTGLLIVGQFPMYEYKGTHAAVPVTGGDCYWIEIVDTTPAGESFFWDISFSNNSMAVQDTALDGYDAGDVIANDLAFCLTVDLDNAADCMTPVGTCCANDGSCSESSEAACVAGDWTEGAVCTPNPCLPKGGCCVVGVCQLETAPACAALGGIYNGDGTDCSENGPSTTTSANPATPIPDNDPIGVSHTINIPAGITIADVDISLGVTHTWVGDLCVTVTHNATSVDLVVRSGTTEADCQNADGFGCSEGNYNIVLDDEAGSPIEDACDAGGTFGSFSPVNALSAFDGMDSTGDWTITVTDSAGGDTGTLDSWAVTVSEAGTPPCDPVGACCGCPDENSCQVLTQAECEAIPLASYLGDGDATSCDLPPGPAVDVDSGLLFLGIPDNDPTGVSHDLNMGSSFAVQDVNVGLNITHTWVGDLCVTVSHGATSVDLVVRPGTTETDCQTADGFGCAEDNYAITLDDAAASSIEDACTPGGTVGAFIPASALSAFNGADSAGVWSISVTDAAGGDTGTLDSWSLSLGQPSTDPPVCTGQCFVCGNGILETPFEECDPGAFNPSDCCDDTCHFVVAGGSCGDGAGVCSAQDTCDGAGTCNPNHAAAGTLCGSPANECSDQDTCDGFGGCSLNDLPLGTDCGNPADMPGSCFTGDSCSGGGVCIPGTIVTACIDDDLCCSRTTGCSDENDNDCEADVPTVSTWGLLVLALLLAAAGKVYFGRRESVA